MNDLGRSLSNVCGFATRAMIHDNTRQDVAIYLTKDEFGAAGYAHVDGMCRSERSCALVLEDGFTSAFVLSHELGHV